MMLYIVEPECLLFGTDWPISTMDSYINFMKQLDLEKEDKDLIISKNAARLFKIDVSQLKCYFPLEVEYWFLAIHWDQWHIKTLLTYPTGCNLYVPRQPHITHSPIRNSNIL